MKHNGLIDEEKRDKNGNSTVNGEMINKFTDLSQQTSINAKKHG